MTIDLDQVADDAQLDDQGRRPGEEGYGETKVDQAIDSNLAKDNQEIVNEENVNEDDNSKAEDNVDSKLTILVNGETVQISEDFTGTHVMNKDEGHGLHVQKNGDIIILSGSGGKGNTCGGRLLINTKNGQITKSGPIVVDATASASSSTEGGASTTEGSANSQVAYSGSFSGDHEVEVQGTKYVKARDIVLDATDTLTLRGNKIIVQADEWVEEKGLEKSKVDSVEEEITSQRTSEVKEDTAKQYDTRATQNVVGSGHINQRVKGDYQLLVDGIANIQVMAQLVTAPLVRRNGNLGLMIGVNSSQGQDYGIRLSAASFLDFAAGSGNISLSTARGIHLDTQVMETDQGVNGVDTNAAGIGEIKVDAAKGFNLTSWKEDINIETHKTAGGKVKITGKEGIEVESTTGDFKVTAAKIYLN